MIGYIVQDKEDNFLDVNHIFDYTKIKDIEKAYVHPVKIKYADFSIWWSKPYKFIIAERSQRSHGKNIIPHMQYPKKEAFENTLSLFDKDCVMIEYEKEYAVARVRDSNKNIMAAFATKHNDYAPYMDGKIAMDHLKCFDKPSKCPLILPLPENEFQVQYLKSQLQFWSSKEGLKISDNYEFEKYITKYPKRR
jgi:hypothetical protein